VLHRLLLMGLLAALVAFAIWDLVRRNPHLLQRGAGSRRPAPRPVPPPSVPAGKVLAFERAAHDVLGVPEGASRADIDAAYARLKAEWAPERLAGMSDELRTLAQRRSAELERAYRSLTESG
jgi:DnaJ-domain-containing protein 1